jgi:hypothetical protein
MRGSVLPLPPAREWERAFVHARCMKYEHRARPALLDGAAQLHAEAGAARLRPGSRAAYVVSSAGGVTAVAVRQSLHATSRRQPARRSDFGARDRPHSLA